MKTFKAAQVAFFNLLSPKIKQFSIITNYYLIQQFEANHNKDYSVVKTFKAAQVAFFVYQVRFNKQFIDFLILHFNILHVFIFGEENATMY